MPSVARAIPWARVFAVAGIVVDRVGADIPTKDRKRVATLLRESKGDPRRLTAAERREIVRIVRQVDVAKLGRDVAATLALAKSGRLLKRD